MSESNIESKVPGYQKLRGVNQSETANATCEETSETDSHYEPVITVTKQETAITKGDIKTQKITVTEDVSHEEETKTEKAAQVADENLVEQTMKTAVETINVEDRSDDAEKPQHGDKKARTKIPMLKLKRAMREITENRKKLEENDKEIPIQKRKSSIPRLKDVKSSTLTENANKEVPISIVSPRTDEEFDKIFEEIIVKEHSPSFIKDPEKLNSKFEEIIHAYDENKIEPINIEKNKSKIPMLKRKSEHDIEITKQIDRKGLHKKRLSIDNTHNSSSHPKNLTLNSTSTENKSNHEIVNKDFELSTKLLDKNGIETQESTTVSELVSHAVEINSINSPASDTNKEKLPHSDVSTFKTIAIESDENTKFQVSKNDKQDYGIEKNPTLKKSISVDNNSAKNTSLQKSVGHNIRRTVSHQNEKNTYDTLSSNILVQKIMKAQETSALANTEQNYSPSFNNDVASKEYLSDTNVQNGTDTSATYKAVKYDSACQETSKLIRKFPDASEPKTSENINKNNANLITSDTSNIETFNGYSTIETALPSINVKKENNRNEIHQETDFINNISNVPSEVAIQIVENKPEKIEEKIVNNVITESNNIDTSTFQPLFNINDEHESLRHQIENENSTQEGITQIVNNDDNYKTASENVKRDVETSVIIVEEDLTIANDINLEVNQKEGIQEQVSKQGELSTLENVKETEISSIDTSTSLINENELEFTKNKTTANILNAKDTQKDTEINKIANTCRFEENPNQIANSTINKHIEEIKEKRMQDKNVINDLLKTDMPEEDIIILKGKVNRVINRLDSKIDTECINKQNIVDGMPNKAVLSKIALFEQKDATENNTLKKTSRSQSQPSGDLPKIVDEVLKTHSQIGSTIDINKVETAKLSAKPKVSWSKIENKKRDFDKINKKKEFATLKSMESDEFFDEKYKIKKEAPRIEIKRELSYAETDLGDSVKGKVRQMVVRMVSLERMDLDMRGIIDIKDKPKSGSVSEKIAMFEKQVTPVKTSKANTSKTARKEETEENMSEEEFNCKVEELLGAKKKYGRITDLKYIELNDGCMMPAVGVGTALLSKNLTKHIVSTAIDLGYRTIDTAYIYGNEKEIGEAINEKIRDGTVKREDLFVISKLWSTFHRRDLVEKACKLSLKAMGLEYFDLYLIHNPMSFKEGDTPIPKIANVIQYSESDYLDAWYGVEQIVKKSLARRAGVSNFNSAQLDRIIDKGRIKPVVNQVECHPYLTQYRLDEFCQSRDVKMSSYGVLGSKGTPMEMKSGLSPVIDDPMVLTMAAGLNITPAQLLISYQLHLDHSVVVKASSGSRLWSNLQAQQVRLETSHISALNALNRNKRNFTFKGFGDTHRNYPFRIPF